MKKSLINNFSHRLFSLSPRPQSSIDQRQDALPNFRDNCPHFQGGCQDQPRKELAVPEGEETTPLSRRVRQWMAVVCLKAESISSELTASRESAPAVKDNPPTLGIVLHESSERSEVFLPYLCCYELDTWFLAELCRQAYLHRNASVFGSLILHHEPVVMSHLEKFMNN